MQPSDDRPDNLSDPIHNYRKELKGDWTVEAWTDGSIYHPSGPFRLTLRISSLTREKEMPRDTKVSWELTGAGHVVVTFGEIKPRFERVLRSNLESDFVVDSKLVRRFLSEPREGWEMSVKNWFTVRNAGSREINVPEVGNYVLKVRVALDTVEVTFDMGIAIQLN